MNKNLRHVEELWPEISCVFSVPHDPASYARIVAMVDDLIDETGGDENHPLAGLLDTLGSLVETYEDQNVPEMGKNPVAVLEFLMAEHGLKQVDLREEIGTQGVVSEVLRGKRKLNLRQIEALSRRFGVSPAVFIGG